MQSDDTQAAVVAAALRLAETRAWNEIGLGDIAQEAGLDLAVLSEVVSSKADILKAFMRQTDRALLQSLHLDPVEGEPHDRLFDVMLRRIEQLTPHKKAVAGLIRGPASSPLEWAALIGPLLDSQTWMLAAAKLESSGLRGDLQRLVLARIYSDVLQIWVQDDDEGMARTMAALDRKLRDAAQWAKRFETPVAIATGLAKAWRSRHTTTQSAAPKDEASHATAD